MKTSINKDIIRLAIPNIISNITVPLLSMVDMSIVGHLSLEVYIGAIASATLIFNFLYWSFAFLRMGTSGFTAQAFGANNAKESANVLLRSLLVALLIGCVIIALQRTIFEAAFTVINSSSEVKAYAAAYFDIYIWTAPIVLAMYTFSGWFIGMQDARTPMYIAISVNCINIALSIYFVYVLHLSIEGIALASALAQLSGLLMAIALWYIKYKQVRLQIDLKVLKRLDAYIPFFKVNSDIFIRTMLLISVTVFFTSQSARMGDTMLAANAILMQLFILYSYIMDGFAYAAEALTGKYIGAKQTNQLKQLIKSLFAWGLALAVLFTSIYGLFTEQIIGLLTDKPDVISICKQYKIWALLIPIAGFSAFTWDGIFIGATASRQMHNSMFVAATSFFFVYYISYKHLGNNGLWMAFIIYLSMRGIIQTFLFRKIKKAISRNFGQ
ncbi:MAG: hypothetical protein RL662_1300 [Bacteroidota bacterium]|jgi:MATE family multidrug resistance protein